jgi:starch phosphorylase
LKELYEVLISDVIPTYYGDRTRWIDMMRASIDMSHWQFSSRRMIREYYDLMYREEDIRPRRDAWRHAGEYARAGAPAGGEVDENVFVYIR